MDDDDLKLINCHEAMDRALAVHGLLSRLPKAARRATRAEGYRLADTTLKANAEIVPRIAVSCWREDGALTSLSASRVAN
jgi:hypothetical protein